MRPPARDDVIEQDGNQADVRTNTKVSTQFKPVSATATPNTFVGARGIDSVTGAVCGPPTTGTCVASNDVSGPDGVMTVENKQLWVGDGNSRVWVLDASSGNLVPAPAGATNPISTVRPGSNPNNRADELCFDSADHLVMVANNADSPPFASIISTDTFKVVKQIAFDGSNGAPNSNNGAEQCQWSPRTGKFYISIPGIAGHPDGEGGVAVIDPKTMTVVDTFIIPVADCAAPQGMAVGPSSQILLGCNAPSPNGHSNTVIINERSGAVVGRLPDLGGNDEVWFNEGDGHYFLAGGQNVPNEQLGIVDSNGHRPDKTVITAANPNATARRAHSIAADRIKTRCICPFLPRMPLRLRATTARFVAHRRRRRRRVASPCSRRRRTTTTEAGAEKGQRLMRLVRVELMRSGAAVA